jgi:hypothetical protein
LFSGEINDNEESPGDFRSLHNYIHHISKVSKTLQNKPQIVIFPAYSWRFRAKFCLFVYLFVYIFVYLFVYFSGEINDNEEDDDEIHQDEINEYLNKVQEQRAELRNNLRQKFEQLCANGR